MLIFHPIFLFFLMKILSWKVKYQETCDCDQKLKSKYGLVHFYFQTLEDVPLGFVFLVNCISNLFFSKNRANFAQRRATEGGGGAIMLKCQYLKPN